MCGTSAVWLRYVSSETSEPESLERCCFRWQDDGTVSEALNVAVLANSVQL